MIKGIFCREKMRRNGYLDAVWCDDDNDDHVLCYNQVSHVSPEMCIFLSNIISGLAPY